MRKWAILAVILLLSAAVGALGLQYLMQRNAVAAVQELMATHAGVSTASFRETGRAFRAQGRRSDDFGPAGASVGRSNMPLCYNAAGLPVPSDDPGDAVCRQVQATQFLDSEARLRAILNTAKPGDVYEILPGTYHIKGVSLPVGQPGEAASPIVLRAARLGDVHIEFDMNEGFSVRAPYWVFENLEIRGVCPSDGYCEHAFHLSRDARATVIRNNRLSDFNAQIKINGAPDGLTVPDGTMIDHNNLIDSHPRDTGSPVTKLDSVRAGKLTITGNVIADFAKKGADQRSYGAFTKGGGSGNRMERNLVICEWMNRGGARIGLSFGGGGTGAQYCVGGSCKIEDRGGVMRSNVVIGCSDDGIYLRRAAGARIERNLLVGTRGLDARFETTNAAISGNIFDGRMMAWNSATLTPNANIDSGWRAVLLRQLTPGLFNAPLRGDFGAKGGWPAAPVTPGSRDFCGTVFPAGAAAGPFGPTCAPDIPALR